MEISFLLFFLWVRANHGFDYEYAARKITRNLRNVKYLATTQWLAGHLKSLFELFFTASRTSFWNRNNWCIKQFLISDKNYLRGEAWPRFWAWKGSNRVKSINSYHKTIQALFYYPKKQRYEHFFVRSVSALHASLYIWTKWTVDFSKRQGENHLKHDILDLLKEKWIDEFINTKIGYKCFTSNSILL